MKKFLLRPEIILIIAAAIVLAVVYFMPAGAVQTDDRAEFLTRMGLEQVQTAESSAGVQYKNLSDAQTPSSSFELLVYGVKSLTDPFSLTALFVIYSVMFLLGLFLIVRNISGNSIVVKAASVIIPLFVFCDLAYTGSFMSLYEEPFIFSVLMLFIGLLLDAHKKGGITWLRGIAIALCGTAFGTVNIMTAVTAVILGIAVILFCNMGKEIQAGICGALIIILSVVFMYTYVPADRNRNLYNSVFFGVCNYDSVTELGLGGSLDELKGVPYSQQVVQSYDLENRFYNDINYSDVIGYYAAHPKSFVDALSNPPGNYGSVWTGYTSGAGESGTAALTLYSTLKSKLLGKTLSGIGTWLFIYYVLLIVTYKNADKKRRVFLNLLILPGVVGLLSLLFPVILSGTCGFGKNMFIFNICLDFMVFISIVGGVWELLRRRRDVRDRYGVTQ